MSPEKSAGLEVIACGPGWMLWIIIALTISAMVAFAGRPRTSMGIEALGPTAVS